MRNFNCKKFLLIIGMFILIINIPITYKLAIFQNEKLIAIFCLNNNDDFQIGYTHSVNKSPVWDTIKRVDKRFLVTETHFYSFGAGIPVNIENNEKLVIEEDHLVLKNINRNLDDINLYVGRVAEHKIKINCIEYILSNFIEPGKSIKFKIAKISILNQLLLYKNNY